MQADQRLLKEIDLPLETRGRFGWEEQASSGYFCQKRLIHHQHENIIDQ